MRLIDWLMTHPLASRFEELFATSSPPELLSQIREVRSPRFPLESFLTYLKALDTGDEFKYAESSWGVDDVTLAFGETLLEFLDSLTESVVPPNAYFHIANPGIEHDGEVSHHTGGLF